MQGAKSNSYENKGVSLIFAYKMRGKIEKAQNQTYQYVSSGTNFASFPKFFSTFLHSHTLKVTIIEKEIKPHVVTLM